MNDRHAHVLGIARQPLHPGLLKDKITRANPPPPTHPEYIIIKEDHAIPPHDLGEYLLPERDDKCVNICT